VTQPLTTHAPLIDRRGGLILVTIIIILILLDFVLAVFAAGGFFGPLAATPPHITRPFGFMRAAAPVEILLLNILFATLPTTLLISVDFAAPAYLCQTIFEPRFLVVEYGVHLDDLRHLLFVLRQRTLGIFEVAVEI
jgi:hypothetical protein